MQRSWLKTFRWLMKIWRIKLRQRSKNKTSTIVKFINNISMNYTKRMQLDLESKRIRIIKTKVYHSITLIPLNKRTCTENNWRDKFNRKEPRKADKSNLTRQEKDKFWNNQKKKQKSITLTVMSPWKWPSSKYFKDFVKLRKIREEKQRMKEKLTKRKEWGKSDKITNNEVKP